MLKDAHGPPCVEQAYQQPPRSPSQHLPLQPFHQPSAVHAAPVIFNQFKELLARCELIYQDAVPHRPQPKELNYLPDAPASFVLALHQSVFERPTPSVFGHVYRADCRTLSKFLFTFDSGSDTRLLTLEAALQFTSQQISNLRVIGVSGKAENAELMGNLTAAVVDPVTALRYDINLGRAHAMGGCPMNLLSVSLLIKVGAIVHLERNNSYFQAHSGAANVRFLERDGMF